jgi:hypothetical protein
MGSANEGRAAILYLVLLLEKLTRYTTHKEHSVKPYLDYGIESHVREVRYEKIVSVGTWSRPPSLYGLSTRYATACLPPILSHLKSMRRGQTSAVGS